MDIDSMRKDVTAKQNNCEENLKKIYLDQNLTFKKEKDSILDFKTTINGQLMKKVMKKLIMKLMILKQKN